MDGPATRRTDRAREAGRGGAGRCRAGGPLAIVRQGVSGIDGGGLSGAAWGGLLAVVRQRVSGIAGGGPSGAAWAGLLSIARHGVSGIDGGGLSGTVWAGRLAIARQGCPGSTAVACSVHVSRILAKLGVRSRTEAAAVAHRQGLAGDDAASGLTSTPSGGRRGS